MSNTKRTTKEQRMFEQAESLTLNRLLEKQERAGRDIEEMSEEELSELREQAHDSAEAAFDHWVNQGIDERKERNTRRGLK